MISFNQRGSLVFKRETTASIIMAHGFEFYFTLFIFVNIFLLIPCHLPEKIVNVCPLSILNTALQLTLYFHLPENRCNSKRRIAQTRN